jgi:hydrogenase-4 component B
MAIAGLPPLNGFASEWLTLQALLHVALGHVGDGHRGRARARGARATAALASSASSRSSGSCCSGRRGARARDAVEGRCRCGRALAVLAGWCVVLGVAPGLLLAALVGDRPWPRTSRRIAACTCPAPAACRRWAIAVALVAADAAALRRARGGARRRPRRPGRAGSSSSRR